MKAHCLAFNRANSRVIVMRLKSDLKNRRVGVQKNIFITNRNHHQNRHIVYGCTIK
jgi:hypothetical protein